MSLRGFLRSIVSLVLVLAVLQPVAADVVKPAFALDGHWWQKQSKETKFATVQSMVDAERYGYLNGYGQGLEDAAKIVPSQKSHIAALIDRVKPLQFSHPITFYVFVVDLYYSSTKHLETPLVYVVTCTADQTLKSRTCKPYGAQRALPTPVP